MGRAPAYVFVVRHGNRLDAANKQWHLQSPTPYDPPLTFSGWGQARALGQKIGEIIKERELQDESSVAKGPARKRRKYKVVIHSSPFLRCVQTSIGISAGLASLPQFVPQEVDDRSPSVHTSNARSRPIIDTDMLPSALEAQLLPSLPISDADSHPGTPTTPLPIQKTVLRLDAFLGEWLTPGYFELITPPPGSGLMLASAKAELLRKEDYAIYFPTPTHPHHNPGSGQMWGQSPVSARPSPGANGGSEKISSMAQALSRAGRSSSVTNNSSAQGHARRESLSYVSPVPAYAISHNGEIPKGFVPHARDNCCAIDYQWDSMRGPFNWGDGGQFGEEWTEMHRRFRKGLQRLLDWYCTAENPTEMVTKTKRSDGSEPSNGGDGQDEEDVEIESVVILVSHGAGCNAMVGAITHQPVLADVGLASLTQAVRKPEKDGDAEISAVTRPDNTNSASEASPELIAIHRHYDLKLFASTQHLQSPHSRSPSINLNRGRAPNTTISASSLGGAFLYDGSGSRSSSAAANLASMRRESASARPMPRIGLNTSGMSGGITVGSGVTSFTRQSPQTGSPARGLWSPLRNGMDALDDDDDDMLPNFSNFDMSSTPTAAQQPQKPVDSMTPARENLPVNRGTDTKGGIGVENGDASENKNENRTGNANVNDNSIGLLPKPAEIADSQQEDEVRRELGSGTGGLWGSPRPILEADDILRDLSRKRRWTVNERW